MKIAVCLSGQPRTVAHVWKSLYVKFLSHFDYDLFIHSPEEYPVGADFWEILRPKAYRVEPQTTIDEPSLHHTYFCRPIINNYLQQVKGYRSVWQLKEKHKEQYAWVVRTRPDVEYHEPILPEMFDMYKIGSLLI